MAPSPLYRFVVMLALFIAWVGQAQAGVTIHYEGRAKSPAAVNNALSLLTARARVLGWRAEDASAKNISLTRVIDEKDVPFDSSLFVQDFVKTQFAGPDVHIKVIELLRQLKPFFVDFKVEDEGEYWETHDRQQLEKHIEEINSLIQEMKGKTPGLKGPITLPNGRIVDLMR